MTEREYWEVLEHPGYLGSRRGKKIAEWNEQYGEGNWRLSHFQTRDRKILGYDDVFQVYVDGYEKYFQEHRNEADFIVKNYSYGYDQDLIRKEQAFDPYALYDKPGIANQFHHVAFNRAILLVTGQDFQGSTPVQVREGKPGTPDDKQPNGYKWSPGRIPCVNPELIPKVQLSGNQWWQNGSVEDFYQKAKVLEVKRRGR